MSNRVLASCVAVAALCAGPVSGANAEDGGFYFSITGGMASADLSRTDIDNDFGGSLADEFADVGIDTLDYRSSLDDSDAAWGAQVGYQWGSHFAVEGGYITLGEALYDADMLISDGVEDDIVSLPIRFRSGGFTAAAVGILPLGENFEVHGRGGILFSRNRVRVRLVDFDSGDVIDSFELRGNAVDPFIALGGAWKINANYTLSLDYQRFLDVGDDEDTPEYDIDMVSLSIQFR